ncbi:MAG: formate dehydrogenase major subunit [Pyrococcus sp.]|nr:formate dehydrogenase major subunit [Pyrococcus sp.]
MSIGVRMSVKVVCPYCGFGCNLLVDTITKKVRPYRGEPNRGKLCPKGLFALEHVYSKDRLRYPLKREGSDFKRISWERAISEIAEKIREIIENYGPSSIAFIASSKITNEENYLL